MLSVIIPSHNRGNLIKETIESVVCQDYKDVEIIIIDDASDENNLNKLKHCIENYQNVSLFENMTNKGAGLSRKEGFIKSNGKYVVFIDDDDFYCDNTFFSKAIKILEENDNIGFVSAQSYDYFIEDKSRAKRELNVKGLVDAYDYLINFQYKYSKPDFFATVFRRDVIELPIKKEMVMVNDAPVHLQALINSKNVYVLDDFVGCYVKHGGNISFNMSCDFIIDNLKEKYNVMIKMIDSYEDNDIIRWWNGQINVTVNYYIYSIPKVKDICKLFIWLYHNKYKNSLFITRKLLTSIGKGILFKVRGKA